MAWKKIKKQDCTHLQEIQQPPQPNQTKCQNCDISEDLRLCLNCGYVACCESHSSHNTAHFKATNHPVIKPFRCNYDWLWCYSCNAFLE